MNESHIVYKELSYEIGGVLIKVHNDLGRYCSEKQYGDRVEYYFKLFNIPYIREFIIPISFEGEHTGRNKADFLVYGKIILELKAIRMLGPEDYYQTQRYLKATDNKLGLLVNFRDKLIKPRRVLNSEAKEKD